MVGSCFLSHSTGWACSNDVSFDVEKDIDTDEAGNKFTRQTNTLKIKGLFNGKGDLVKDMQVDCVFKIDETGQKQGFIGVVAGIMPSFTSVIILSKTERIKEIINKIKGGH